MNTYDADVTSLILWHHRPKNGNNSQRQRKEPCIIQYHA